MRIIIYTAIFLYLIMFFIFEGWEKWLALGAAAYYTYGFFWVKKHSK